MLVTAAAAAFAGLATPAGAAPGDARAHCTNRAEWTSSTLAVRDFELDGKTGPQQVQLPDLEPGDLIRITASGRVHNGTIVGQWRGPEGSMDDPAPDAFWPATGVDKFSLYSKFGRNGHVFKAGQDSGCVDYTTAFGTGLDTLYVGVNDDLLRDNSGSFRVHVAIWRNPNEIRDGGFEGQRSRTISAPWVGEGPGGKGVDVARNLQHSGANNAFIRTTTGWNAISQEIAVRPDTRYRMRVWLRTSGNFHAGFFGVRPGNTPHILEDQQYGSFVPAGYEPKTLDFDSGPNRTVTAFIGYWGPGYDSWVQVDDVAIWPVV